MNVKHYYDEKHQFFFMKFEDFIFIRLHHEYNISFIAMFNLKFNQQYIDSFKILKKIGRFVYRKLIVESDFEFNFWIRLKLSDSTLRLDSNRVDFFFFWIRLDSNRIEFWDLKSTRIEFENYVIHQNFYKLHYYIALS